MVVLFHPDEGAIASLLNLVQWGYAPVAVVNAAEELALERLRTGGVADLIVNDRNIGLAAALNQGIESALARGVDYVLLLDQDSRPDARMGPALVAVAAAAAERGIALGCVGPVLIDRKALGRQAMAGAGQGEPLLPAASIATSGAMTSARALRAVGGMWEALFIDGIDHEWCFRASAAGYGVFVAAHVRMDHDMGDQGVDFLGRYKPIHRSSFRHFHIVRNGLWLARLAYIPPRWRTVETTKFLYRVPVYLLVGRDRLATFKALVRGLWQGLHRAPEQPPRGQPSPTPSTANK